jgi:hypothetical protein
LGRGWTGLKTAFARPVNGASLAVFRIALGLVMTLEAISLFLPNPAGISSGLSALETYYTGADIRFHFPYEGFEWLPLLPSEWIHAMVILQALAGLTMALGLFHRTSTATVFLVWCYLWAVESTRTYWQSHYYLETLLTFLLIWMPAARRYSLDAWLNRNSNTPGTVPFWAILLLRGQLVIAYFYAGVAKLNADWILDAVPVRWFLREPGVLGPYEPYLSSAQFAFAQGIIHSAWFAHFISLAGLVFDLTVGFLLLARRTRAFALVLMILFHTTNHFLIFDDIGWFRLVGMLSALIFLKLDWPEKLWHWLRAPRLPRPDRAWLIAGAICFPVVGAALGWRSRPDGFARSGQTPPSPGSWTTPLVVAWLVWQALLPTRQFWIPGDGRITYEGQSFSWRLKADVRDGVGHQLIIEDSEIISRDATGPMLIDWTAWNGEPVIHREVAPGRIPWNQLPEIVALVEPVLGERIVYNPFSTLTRSASQTSSPREHVNQIWRQLHGRPPQAVHPGLAFPDVLELIATALRESGDEMRAGRFASVAERIRQIESNQLEPAEALEIGRAATALLSDHRDHEVVIPLLRRLHPFTLEGEGRYTVPFLIIEDPLVVAPSSGQEWRIDRTQWRHGAATRDAISSRHSFIGGEPLVIHAASFHADEGRLFPQSYVFDSLDRPDVPPTIRWNSDRDLTRSKYMHTSTQAFYLQRYASRVADLWEAEYSRRPKIFAITAVSLNGRPHQDLVDPEVDLAGVNVKRLGHNDWILDLQTPRIPPDALHRSVRLESP